MMLNTKSRYAVMAMVYLSAKAESAPHTLANISATQEIPLSYLEQIFLILRKQGLVNSVRGPGGGYVLAHPAEEIRVSDIVQAVEEPMKMTRCEQHDHGGCLSDKTRCLTHNLWEGLENMISGYFSAITLADIVTRRLPPMPVAATPESNTQRLPELAVS
jgi:Rrf2 family iron-sulfur cluster assembly transcriptional regulator